MEFLNYLSNELEKRSKTYRKMNQGMKDIDFPFYKIFSAAAAGSLLAGCYRGVVPTSISAENSQGSSTNNPTKESGFNPETKNIPKVEAPLKEDITKAFKLCGDCNALGIEENDIRGGYFGSSDFLFIATDKYGFDRTWLVQGSNVIPLDYGSDLDPTTGKITWYAFSQPEVDINQETYVPKVYFEWVPGLEDEYHNHFIYYQPDGTIFTRQEFILPSSLGLSEFITENPVDVPAGFVDPSEEFNKTQEEIATTSAYTLNGITGKLEYTNPDRSISIVDGISDTDKNGIFEIANTDGTETEATVKTIDENSITLVAEDGTTWRIENGVIKKATVSDKELSNMTNEEKLASAPEVENLTKSNVSTIKNNLVIYRDENGKAQLTYDLLTGESHNLVESGIIELDFVEGGRYELNRFSDGQSAVNFIMENGAHADNYEINTQHEDAEHRFADKYSQPYIVQKFSDVIYINIFSSNSGVNGAVGVRITSIPELMGTRLTYLGSDDELHSVFIDVDVKTLESQIKEREITTGKK